MCLLYYTVHDANEKESATKPGLMRASMNPGRRQYAWVSMHG